MLIRIIQLGKTKDAWLQTGINEYLKRLGPFVRLEVIELPDVSLKVTGSPEVVKEKEAEAILSKIDNNDHVVVLDEAGERKTSLEFSAFLTNISENKRVVFVIGGVYGVSQKLHQRADALLSLSSMTFTHRMVRLILAEQLYRAFMIKANRSYHY